MGHFRVYFLWSYFPNSGFFRAGFLHWGLRVFLYFSFHGWYIAYTGTSSLNISVSPQSYQNLVTAINLFFFFNANGALLSVLLCILWLPLEHGCSSAPSFIICILEADLACGHSLPPSGLEKVTASQFQGLWVLRRQPAGLCMQILDWHCCHRVVWLSWDVCLTYSTPVLQQQPLYSQWFISQMKSQSCFSAVSHFNTELCKVLSSLDMFPLPFLGIRWDCQLCRGTRRNTLELSSSLALVTLGSTRPVSGENSLYFCKHVLSCR